MTTPEHPLVRCAWNNLRVAAIFFPVFAAVTVAAEDQALVITAALFTGVAGGIVIGLAIILTSGWLHRHTPSTDDTDTP